MIDSSSQLSYESRIHWIAKSNFFDFFRIIDSFHSLIIKIAFGLKL